MKPLLNKANILKTSSTKNLQCREFFTPGLTKLLQNSSSLESSILFSPHVNLVDSEDITLKKLKFLQITKHLKTHLIPIPFLNYFKQTLQLLKSPECPQIHVMDPNIKSEPRFEGKTINVLSQKDSTVSLLVTVDSLCSKNLNQCLIKLNPIPLSTLYYQLYKTPDNKPD